jgi:glycopeptide antibiotics resistance protein
MKKFIEERWYMHLVGGAVIVTPIICLLIKFDPSFDIGKIAQVFIAGFFAYCIGFMWEWYFAAFHEAPFDYNDIWFTVLGALIGTSLL